MSTDVHIHKKYTMYITKITIKQFKMCSFFFQSICLFVLRQGHMIPKLLWPHYEAKYDLEPLISASTSGVLGLKV